MVKGARELDAEVAWHMKRLVEGPVLLRFAH
jgi:hypothetical protein